MVVVGSFKPVITQMALVKQKTTPKVMIIRKGLQGMGRGIDKKGETLDSVGERIIRVHYVHV